MAGWRTIGKYHARINLGRVWVHRKIAFPALSGGFIAYVLILYVLFARYKTTILTALQQAGMQAGIEIAAFSVILSLLVFAIWGYIIYVNVFVGIKKRKKRDVASLLSTPITYSNLLMGSFLAMLPTVAIAFAFVYTPIALAATVVFESGLVALLKIGVALGEIMILALLVSGIVLAIIEPLIDRISRNRVVLIFFIIIFIVVYSLSYILPQQGLGLGGVSDNVFYRFVPTTLAGNIINEALLGAFGFRANPSGGLSMLLLGVIILVVFFAGFYSTGRFFTLELGIKTSTLTIGKEGIFYRLLRRFGIDERVIFHSKVFFRNPKNALQFGMMSGIVYVFPFFLLSTSAADELLLVGTISGFIMIAFMTPFLSLTVYALSKDAMWLWKSAPDGERSFIVTKWKQSLITSLVYVPLPVVIGLRVKTPVSYILLGIIVVILLLASTTSIALFVSTYNPVYDVGGAKIQLNFFITFGIIFGLIALTAESLVRIIGVDFSSEFSFYNLILIFGSLANVLGAVLMKLSIRKLVMRE